MISSLFLKAGVAACAALIVIGCATTTGPALQTSGARYDPNKPQTFLARATVDQAKGVAMGSAVSKGWSVVESTDDSLVLRRDLNPASAGGVSPGAAVAPMRSVVEVRSTFFQRDMGVDVVLDAQVVTGRGTEQEKRIDYTENYRQELMESLSSLNRVWSKTAPQVASAVPPLPTGGAVPSTPATAGAAPEVAGEAAAVPVASTAVARPPVVDAPSAWGPTRFSTVTPEPVVPAPAVPVEERSLAGAPAPVEEASKPVAAVEGTSPDRGANMLVLNPTTDTGLWSYYAEHYARIRGCNLTDGGAVLIEKQDYSETHRVDCEGGRNFLVRCNAGVCRGLR